MNDSKIEEKKRKAVAKQFANLGPRPGTVSEKKELIQKDSDKLSSEILILYKGILTNLSNSVRNVIEIGEKLSKRKSEIEYGLFTEWIEQTFPFSVRTAQRWMEVHTFYQNKEFIINDETDLSTVYELITEKKKQAKEKIINDNKVAFDFKELRVRLKNNIALSKAEGEALKSYLTEAQNLIKSKAKKKVSKLQKEIDLIK
ncbi:DUF3102 domain-containing protein [Leptospira kmetyi]|uniref:DUF3102 domain-containing protein n=1 Tax=Leptospira kmetyi TaxID=408139 RepID=A0ABX4N5Y6_9LEPT|nr:DUF3102 domain-containing protein [Leptospira kmetyi]PJZ28719.1 hypothetical protein CH378_16080 [Leptospira kmetyi]PJZ39509.1 hypothetical protein CH370_20855 [Leptospira kmetyi]